MRDTGLLPRLEPRHAAMLAEMGVNVWWQGTQQQEPPAASSVGTPGGRRDRDDRPVKGPVTAPHPARLSAGPESCDAVSVEPRQRSNAPVVTVPPQPPTLSPPAVQRAVPPPLAAPAPRAPARAVIPLAEMPADQAALADAIRSCSACDLGSRRRHAVPGMGDPAPDWMIVGEAPGEEEDRQGLPFVGRAGQLLDRMLAAMGLDRQHKVHIANVIKCRPPHNRNPDPVEIAQCEPWLLRQVELLQPRIILALGRFAAHTLLAHSPAFPNPDALRQLPLGKLRGRVHEVEIAGRRLPLVVSYHPAYLLRSPGEKAKSWADLCLALDAFSKLPGRG